MKKPSTFNYDLIADDYESWYYGEKGRAYAELEKEALFEFLTTMSPGSRLLDAGCGTGFFTQYFRQLGFKVTALDPFMSMMKKAQEKKLDDLVAGSGMELPFMDGVFDVTVSVTAIEFVPDKRKFISEMARCTRAGGLILTGTLNRRSIHQIRKTLFPSEVKSSAHHLSERELIELLSPWGHPEVIHTAWMLPFRWYYGLSVPLSRIMRSFNIKGGDFLAGAVLKK